MMNAPVRMTLTEYARRQGVSKMAVSKAVSSGRLARSVTRDETGRPWVVNPELADQEWLSAADHTRSPQRAVKPPAGQPSDEDEPSPGELPDSPEGVTMATSAAHQKYWQAKLAKQRFEVAAKQLVPVAEVRGRLEGAFLACRGKLLALPTRLRQELSLGAADVAKAERLIREALEDLADKGAV